MARRTPTRVHPSTPHRPCPYALARPALPLSPVLPLFGWHTSSGRWAASVPHCCLRLAIFIRDCSQGEGNCPALALRAWLWLDANFVEHREVNKEVATLA